MPARAFGRMLSTALGNPPMLPLDQSGRNWGCVVHADASSRVYLVVWRSAASAVTFNNGHRAVPLEALVPFVGTQTVAVRASDDRPPLSGLLERQGGRAQGIPEMGIAALRGIGLERLPSAEQPAPERGSLERVVVYRAVPPVWRGGAAATTGWIGRQRQQLQQAAAAAALREQDWVPYLPFVQGRVSAQLARGVVGGFDPLGAAQFGRGGAEPPERTTVGDSIARGGLMLVLAFPDDPVPQARTAAPVAPERAAFVRAAR